jgi:hypothetical protein
MTTYQVTRDVYVVINSVPLNTPALCLCSQKCPIG